MKSIKPGRGPSFMGGVSSLIMVFLGIIWTVIAASVASGFGGIIGIVFPLFGVCFVVMGIVNAVYNFKNATSKNRYSAFDITDSSEETDPLNEKYGSQKNFEGTAQNTASDGCESSFCPFCGVKVSKEYEFCNNCGKKLP